MSTLWMAEQLSSLARTPPGPEVPRFNPRPAGMIRPGSASEAVLGLLTERGLFLTHAQIVHATGKTTKAVGWALIFLKSQGLIESSTDDSRNPRYQRYRAVRQPPINKLSNR